MFQTDFKAFNFAPFVKGTTDVPLTEIMEPDIEYDLELADFCEKIDKMIEEEKLNFQEMLYIFRFQLFIYI